MKRFILKSTFFVVPFISVYFFYLTNAEISAIKDLSRIGNIKLGYDFFENNLNRELKNVNIEYYGLNLKKDYDILNIGDSFSRQEMKGSNGYLNYLGKKYEILNMPFSNPVQRLETLIKNNFFDSMNIKYVILEMVERNALKNLNFESNFQKQIDIKFYDSVMYEKYKEKFKTLNQTSFFSKIPLTFTYNYMVGSLENNKVQKVMTKQPLFSYSSNELYYYYEDVQNLEQRNNLANLKRLNEYLNVYSNKLREKEIELIVLICPDKYNFYYDEIEFPKFPKTIMFDVFDTLDKQYTFINSNKQLSPYIHLKSDLYFMDDTHWSPIASEIIANGLDEYVADN